MKKFKENIHNIELYRNLIKNLNKNKYLKFKNILDKGIVFALMPFALIFIIIGIIIIKFSSKGPILFKQKRVGLNGRVFTIYKLRTMHHLDSESNLNYTIKNDERIFKTGKILRFTKIDEIPQFFNILMGDMALIGPRPERIEIVEKLSNEINLYTLRHLVKPGLSGLAQINNPIATPNESSEKLEYDLYYINNLTFWLDLKIFWKTIFIVLRLNSL